MGKKGRDVKFRGLKDSNNGQPEGRHIVSDLRPDLKVKLCEKYTLEYAEKKGLPPPDAIDNNSGLVGDIFDVRPSYSNL